MTPVAVAFMVLSWSFVLGLTTWCFARVLRSEKRSEPARPAPVEGGPPGDAEPGGLR